MSCYPLISARTPFLQLNNTLTHTCFRHQVGLPSYVSSLYHITIDDLKTCSPVISQLLQYIRERHLDLEYALYADHITGWCPVHDGWSRNEFSVNLTTGDWFCNSICKRQGQVAELQKLLYYRALA